jgi:hypothetical protein
MAAPGSLELAKNEGEGAANSLVGCGHETGVKEGRMAKEGLWVGRGYSGEGFRP